MRGSRARIVGGVLAAWLLGGAGATTASGAARTLGVIPPFPGADLHMAEAGDTLWVRVRAADEKGQPVEHVRIHARALAGSGDASMLPVPVSAITGPQGTAELPFLLPGGGDFVVLVEAPEERPAPKPVAVRARALPEDWVGKSILMACGGLAIFLYGMRLLGRGLEKAAGNRLRSYLSAMTRSSLRSLAFGTVSTFLVQSSSASTVLLVSFASAGLVTVRQCLGATLGAAVGSSLTVQLIAFRVSDLSLLFVAIGFLLTTLRGWPRRVGGMVLGTGLLFFGLQLMSDAMSPLKGLPGVHTFLEHASRDPVPALVAGALLTALVNTSAATLGILLSLSFQGLITLEAALPLVFGANVGTATTAILASVGSNADGKRVAWAHAAFRLAGVLLFLPFLGPFAALVRAIPGDTARQIANAHTLFGVASGLLFLPFIPLADRLFHALIPDDRTARDDDHPRALDPRFHEQPTVAIAGALQEVMRMGGLVQEMLADVREALRHEDPELTRSIRERDDRVDRLDEQVTKYLTDLSTEVLSPPQSERVLALLFITKDLELIADTVSKGLVPGLLGKKYELDLRFSDEGFQQLLLFHDRVTESVALAVAAVAAWDPDLARRVLDMKRELSTLERQMQIDHLERLRAGNEQSRATTTVHVDALNDLKRIVTHTARIAYAVLGKVAETPPLPGAQGSGPVPAAPLGERVRTEDEASTGSAPGRR